MQTATTTTGQNASNLPMTWTPWINVGIGIAAIITPFIGTSPTSFQISNIVTGIIISIVALLAFFTSRTRSAIDIAVVNVLAGIWLLISMSLAHNAMLAWENVVLGVLAILTAIIGIGVHGQLVSLRDRN
jgi:hypothetical protein